MKQGTLGEGRTCSVIHTFALIVGYVAGHIVPTACESGTPGSRTSSGGVGAHFCSHNFKGLCYLGQHSNWMASEYRSERETEPHTLQ